MKNLIQSLTIVSGLFVLLFVNASAQKAPQTLVLNGEKLVENRAKLTRDQTLKSALTDLTARADKIVKASKLYSVMDKTTVPPSGDKHDYMSQAPYWWADPAKKDGLPYIRHDGEINPEYYKITDTQEMDILVNESETTALAYFFTQNEAYAKHAADLIRTWFIDAKTRQNPNLNFGQGIPGINTGRGIGIIETRGLPQIIDAAILLQSSRSWSKNDHKALKKWFAEYTKWMIESDIGKDESDEKNNHGTFYDVQIIAFSLFADQPEIARKQIAVTKDRIKDQIEPDGSQPLELARTLSWSYTNMNLLGFFILARLAENVNVDLWNFQTPDGRGIKRGLDWVVPFARADKKWIFAQIKPMTYEKTVKILHLAAAKYKRPEYEELAKKTFNRFNRKCGSNLRILAK